MSIAQNVNSAQCKIICLKLGQSHCNQSWNDIHHLKQQLKKRTFCVVDCTDLWLVNYNWAMEGTGNVNKLTCNDQHEHSTSQDNNAKANSITITWKHKKLPTIPSHQIPLWQLLQHVFCAFFDSNISNCIMTTCCSRKIRSEQLET